MTTTRATLALVVAFGLAASAATTASAQDPDVEFILDTPELWEGPWTGFFFAGGTGTQSANGADFVWTTEANGSIALEVAGESIDGTFDLLGTNRLVGRVSAGSISGIYDIVGSGQIGGDPERPSLTGSASTEGEITISGGGFSQTAPAASPPSPFDFDIVLSGAACTQVYGSFELAFEQAAGAEGWQADLFGNVVFTRNTAEIEAAIQEWLATYRGRPIDQSVTPTFPEGTPAIVQAFDQLLRRFNSWADRTRTATLGDLESGEAFWEETRSLIVQLQHLYVDVTNLSACEAELLGAVSDRFENLLTQAVQRVAIFAGGKPDLSGRQLAQIVLLLIAVDGWGPSSPYPEQAAEAESQLHSAAESILDRWWRPDDPDCSSPRGCLLATPDVIEVLVVAAQLGWELELGGRGVDARKLLGRSGLTVPGEGPTIIDVEGTA